MFQFPASPIIGQQFTAAPGIVYRWNGTAWYLIAGASAPLTQEQADLRYLQLASYHNRNVIIGGDFTTNPWQRGTANPAAAGSSYLADHFAYIKAGTAVHTVSKSADAPTVAQAGLLTTDCLLVDCTTAQAVMAAGDVFYMVQHIEGFLFRSIAQRQFTVSFWHKHTKVGTYCVAMRSATPAVDRSCVMEYQQLVSDAWEYSSITFPASPVAGTWNYNNLAGANINFIIACGSTSFTTPGVWQTGNFIATANQVNGCDNALNNFRLALIQVEPGSIATPFEMLDPARVIQMCQRYFCKTMPPGTNPVQGASSTGAICAAGPTFNWRFPVQMRATPVMTTYNVTQANANWRNGANTADLGVVIVTTSADGTQISAGALDGQNWFIHASANAEF